jgi:hypothetical protein
LKANQSFPTHATYRAPIVVRKADESVVNPSNIDSVKYKLTKYAPAGEVVYEADDTMSSVTIEPNESTEDPAEIVVEIPATKVTWTGELHEEMRVTLVDGQSAPVLEREVEFRNVSTSP